MAAGEPKFSHITVTSDEDDIVIQAGARPSRSGDAAVPCDPALPSEPPLRAAFGAEPIEGAGAAEEGRAKPEPESESERDGFRETTLDDLKSAPMSATQKIVLALAAAGVLAIIAYCLFMR